MVKEAKHMGHGKRKHTELGLTKSNFKDAFILCAHLAGITKAIWLGDEVVMFQKTDNDWHTFSNHDTDPQIPYVVFDIDDGIGYHSQLSLNESTGLSYFNPEEDDIDNAGTSFIEARAYIDKWRAKGSPNEPIFPAFI